MVDRPQIQPGMEVIASDGTFVGRVEAVEAQAIRLTRKDSPELRSHHLPLEWVSRVDRHVHLNIGREGLASLQSGTPAPTAAGGLPPVAGAAGAAIGAVGAGAAGHIEPPPGAARPSTAPPVSPPRPATPPPAGGAKVTGNDDNAAPLPPIRNPAVKGARPRSNYYLPWVLGLLGTMLLLFLMLRSCEDSDTDPQVTQTTTSSAPATAPAARSDSQAPVVTGLTTGTIAYDLNAHLASGGSERTFAFDRLNFRTGSARLNRENREDLDDIARVLAAYPTARIAVIGFTDARGDGNANARLGGDRANAVVGELAERGVAPDRMEARSGGEAEPVATNVAEEGRASNRRTELILLSR